MADNTTTGILAELGLDRDVRADARAMARQKAQAANSSSFAGAAAVGRQLGQGIGQAAVPLAGGVLGMAGKVIPGLEGKGFKQGARDMETAAHARLLGISPEQLKAREATQQATSNINIKPTGDPIKDQQATLKEVIRVANQNGDSQTALKAMQKLTQMEAQELAMNKAVREDKAGEREQRYAEETDTTGRTVIMQGDEIDGAHSKAQYEEDTGKWTVIRPDGSVLENVDGLELTFVSPAKRAAQRDRFFETHEGALKNALSVNFLTGKTGEGKRNAVASMGEQADIVSTMSTLLMGMYDPQIAFSDVAKTAGGVDRVVTFVDALANVFSRHGDDSSTTFNGKRTSTRAQYEKATDVSYLEKYAERAGKSVEDLIPAHIRGDTQAMQLFQSQVMRLAYLDARLQEPSNRGLSDNDIFNALQRIGVGSPDPMVFVKNQLETLGRLESKMGNLGVEMAGTSQISKDELINHVYPPEFRGAITDTLASTRAQLEQFAEGYQTGNTGPGSTSTATREMSLEELMDLERRLAAEEAADASLEELEVTE
jgi:hypothetical protein